MSSRRRWKREIYLLANKFLQHATPMLVLAVKTRGFKSASTAALGTAVAVAGVVRWICDCNDGPGESQPIIVENPTFKDIERYWKDEELGWECRFGGINTGNDVGQSAPPAYEESKSEFRPTEPNIPPETNFRELPLVFYKRNIGTKKKSGGIQPDAWPTLEEVNNTKLAREYEEGKFHIAIVGLSGNGKSSLLNSFRGLHEAESQNRSAKTSVVEGTKEITRYPSTDMEPDSLLGSRCIWYDIPGSGTSSHPSEHYFNNHGLYIFDCLVIVVGNRVLETDLMLMKNCDNWKIPFYVVRSKSDMDIKNIYEGLVRAQAAANPTVQMENFDESEYEDDLDKETKTKLKRQAQEQYTTEVRENFKAEVQNNASKYRLTHSNGDIYLVCVDSLRHCVRKLAKLTSSQKYAGETDGKDGISDPIEYFGNCADQLTNKKSIDEPRLVTDILLDIWTRRIIVPGSFQSVLDRYRGGTSGTR